MKFKKLLAGILSAAMVLGTVTLPVFAEDGDGDTETTYVAYVQRGGEGTNIENFTTLEAAIGAANAGDEVILQADYTVKEQIVVDKDISIDFGNHTIKVDNGGTYGSTPAFRILADVTVYGAEITGKYAIDTSDNDSSNDNTRYCFTVGYTKEAKIAAYPNGKAGTLTVITGRYKGDCSAISVNRGAAYIRGGHFDVEPWTDSKMTNDYRYLLNCYGASREAGLANIFVFGGTFTKEYNPADNLADGANTSYVPVGYKSVLYDGQYYVWTGAEGYDGIVDGESTFRWTFEGVVENIINDGVKNDIKLNHSSTISYPVTIEKDCTIDLNGQTLYYAGTCEGGVITITNGAKVTVKDSSAAQTGAIITADGDEERRKTPYVFTVGDENGAGELTIESGFYKGDCTTVYVVNGTANIEGGEFDVEPWTNEAENLDHYRYMINCKDAAHKADKANIVITGGKFKNYNPSQSASESPIANFVAEGCTVTAEGDSYVVTAPVASIGTQKYATLEAAVAAAVNGDTVKLEKDTKVADTVKIEDKKITLDLNGKTVGIEKENNYYYSTFYLSNADVTVTGNGTVDGVISYNDAEESAIGNYAFGVNNNSTLTVKNGTFYAVTSNIHIWTGTVNIEGGEFYVTLNKNVGRTILLNCDDPAYIAGSADFNVTGGTFHKFNPADSKGEPSGANFVADGYEALVEGDVYVVEKTQDTLVDSGWYYKEGAKRGVIRFSFKLNPTNEFGEIVKAGIKYVNTAGGNIEESTVEGAVNTTDGVFYGDIKNIEENSTAKYFAKAYIENASGTKIWAADLLEGSVNWSREFTGYEG